MERATEIDKEAEIAIKYMTDEEIADMFITNEVDILRREYSNSRRESARANINKRWRK